MDSMVERVAKAICAAETGGPFEGGVWEEYSTGQHKEWREAARAAIEAMMEPTFEIIQAGMNTKDNGDGQLHRRKWRAMIQAALSDTEGR